MPSLSEEQHIFNIVENAVIEYKRIADPILRDFQELFDACQHRKRNKIVNYYEEISKKLPKLRREITYIDGLRSCSTQHILDSLGYNPTEIDYNCYLMKIVYRIAK